MVCHVHNYTRNMVSLFDFIASLREEFESGESRSNIIMPLIETSSMNREKRVFLILVSLSDGFSSHEQLHSLVATLLLTFDRFLVCLLDWLMDV